MVDAAYFFDSYAIIELIEGNPAYFPYKQSRMATTTLNLIEVHYHLLRKFGERFAEAFFRSLLNAAVDYVPSIPGANVMRYSMRKKDISTTDCLGYIVAQSAGMKFLTGDKEFKNMPNVEFVK